MVDHTGLLTIKRNKEQNPEECDARTGAQRCLRQSPDWIVSPNM